MLYMQIMPRFLFTVVIYLDKKHMKRADIMLDLNNLGIYKEDNRIEAKEAMGGLPHSIWETYSAFANTAGGIILLGVAEAEDKSLYPIDLDVPEKLVTEFWDIINNPEYVSRNILTEENVQIRRAEGKRVIVIAVPQAEQKDKPVYIGRDVLHGTYVRCGEGDYRCSAEAVKQMIEDSKKVF